MHNMKPAVARKSGILVLIAILLTQFTMPVYAGDPFVPASLDPSVQTATVPVAEVAGRIAAESEPSSTPSNLIRISTATDVSGDEFIENYIFQVSFEEGSSGAHVSWTDGFHSYKLDGKYNAQNKTVVVDHFILAQNGATVKLLIKLRDDLKSIDYAKMIFREDSSGETYIRLDFSKLGLLTSNTGKYMNSIYDNYTTYAETFRYNRIGDKYYVVEHNTKTLEDAGTITSIEKKYILRNSMGEKTNSVRSVTETYHEDIWYSIKDTKFETGRYTETYMHLDEAVFNSLTSASSILTHLAQYAVVQTVAYYDHDELGSYVHYYVLNDRDAEGNWVSRAWENAFGDFYVISIGEPDFLNTNPNDQEDIYLRRFDAFQELTVNGKDVEIDMDFDRGIDGRFGLHLNMQIYDPATERVSYVRQTLNYPFEKTLKIDGANFEVAIVDSEFQLIRATRIKEVAKVDFDANGDHYDIFESPSGFTIVVDEENVAKLNFEYYNGMREMTGRFVTERDLAVFKSDACGLYERRDCMIHVQLRKSESGDYSIQFVKFTYTDQWEGFEKYVFDSGNHLTAISTGDKDGSTYLAKIGRQIVDGKSEIASLNIASYDARFNDRRFRKVYHFFDEPKGSVAMTSVSWEGDPAIAKIYYGTDRNGLQSESYSVDIDPALFDTLPGGRKLADYVVNHALSIKEVTYFQEERDVEDPDWVRIEPIYVISYEKSPRGNWIPRRWEEWWDDEDFIVMGMPDPIATDPNDPKDFPNRRQYVEILVQNDEYWDNYRYEVEFVAVNGQFYLRFAPSNNGTNYDRATLVKFPGAKKVTLIGVTFQIVMDENGYVTLELSK